MADYIGAIDQGTTSTRFIVFDRDGRIVTVDQREHEQINPKAGWVEHDAKEVWRRTREVIGGALANSDLEAGDIAAVGITNQRETTVVWDRETGEPVYNAIVWQDTRTDAIVRELGDADQLREATGLPLSTYFSGPKIKWILDNVDGARERAEAGELAFGTMDTLGAVEPHRRRARDRRDQRQPHAADGPRDARLARAEPRADGHPALDAARRSARSSEAYGEAKGTAIGGTPDRRHPRRPAGGAVRPDVLRRAATRRTPTAPAASCSSTPATEVVRTEKLLTTVGYKLGDGEPTYVLEGSIAVTGALIQWLRDRLKIIDSAPEVEALARTVDDNGGVYFVPAFCGLFAPYWRDDARGVIVGLTAYANRGHIARAALEAAAWQTREVVDAANAVADVPFTELRVDGGMTANELLMQFQADVLGVPVIRPKVTETTALGAAYAAGLATGFWSDQDELQRALGGGQALGAARWTRTTARREYARWKKAVQRSLDWVD